MTVLRTGHPVAGGVPAVDGDFDAVGSGLDEGPYVGGPAVAGCVLHERLDRDVGDPVVDGVVVPVEVAHLRLELLAQRSRPGRASMT